MTKYVKLYSRGDNMLTSRTDNAHNVVDNLKLPELPKLTNGFVIVQEEAWNTLINYINTQTDFLNNLNLNISVFRQQCELYNQNASASIEELKSELTDIAKALEGVYEDEIL